VALVGAIVGQLLAFLLAFLHGAIFGASTTNFVRRSATAYGAQGGKNAVETLQLFYMVSFGLLPVLVSAVGAGLSVAVWNLVRHRRNPKRHPRTYEAPASAGGVDFSCTFCHKPVTMAESYAGQRVQCPHCWLLTKVPANGGSETAE
jgi:hypothetical protein